ncbi:MAG: hypothetical protein QM655_09785 [Nocardioidaceae bacterium]
MTPTIRIDHDVYEALRDAAEPFVDTPNSVLRRLLGLDDDATDSPVDSTAGAAFAGERRGRGRGRRHGDADERRRGSRGEGRPRGPGRFNGNRMQFFFESGALQPGEKLVWERRNNDERYVATVDAEGHFHLDDGSVFETPSGAARHLAGYDVSGWRVWARESDGKSLRDLAREAGHDPGRPGRGHRGGRRGMPREHNDETREHGERGGKSRGRRGE